MSRTYQVRYSSINLGRSEVINRLNTLFPHIPVRVTSSCFELKYDNELREYRYTMEGQEYEPLSRAAVETASWEGVSFELELPFGELSIVLLNAIEKPQDTLLILDHNSALYTEINSNSDMNMKFQRFWLMIADVLDASFCLLECEAEFRELSDDEIQALLIKMNSEEDGYVPLFMVIREDRFSFSEALIDPRNEINYWKSGSFIVIHSNTFGHAPRY